MPVGTEVAAAGPTAGQALTQMGPCGTDLDARGADIQRRIDADLELEMVAELHHLTDISDRFAACIGCSHPTPRH
jgi:hypothetical protein